MSKLVAGLTMPPCFTHEQWVEWRKANMNLWAGRPVHYCTDCTPEYQAEQTGLQRCQNPHATFSRDKDGFLQIDSIPTPTPAQEKP